MPWDESASAYGYAQAQDPAWEDFQDATGQGGSRTNFDDSMSLSVGILMKHASARDFIMDPYNQYLAYHEGRGGYKRVLIIESLV
ncbi:transglycosylase SLT domain-containing protein [Vibrio alginolyticus]|uniref:transglycosylase SLT domain-containing protein n=1 Tax=Vibrio alginolyticus TaxID=663 RepID=UPI0021BD86E4|nr:hypothetical protein [Vibrio alginolyticus]